MTLEQRIVAVLQSLLGATPPTPAQLSDALDLLEKFTSLLRSALAQHHARTQLAEVKAQLGI